jgi:hypothetical protein
MVLAVERQPVTFDLTSFEPSFGLIPEFWYDKFPITRHVRNRRSLVPALHLIS